MNKWVECPRCKHYSAYTKTVTESSTSPDFNCEYECVVCGHKFTEPYAPSFILKHAIKENVKKYQQVIADELNKKEAPTMQVTYNGFTGELVKLQQYSCVTNGWLYELDIYDSEKKCTHLFTGVKLEDVKFLGGEVSFG